MNLRMIQLIKLNRKIFMRKFKTLKLLFKKNTLTFSHTLEVFINLLFINYIDINNLIFPVKNQECFSKTQN